MAKTEQVMQGRVGNVVFYRVKGRTYIRSVPLKYRDANTAMQRSHRLRLMVATRFYQRLQRTFLIDVWRLAAGELAMNGFNLFMKMNLQVFNTRTLFEPPRLKMSFGVLPRLNHPEAEVREGNRIQLTWNYWESGEGAHVGDRLCVVALFEGRMYSPVVLQGFTARRQDYATVLDLGAAWRRRAHLYCFFASPDGGAYSPSDYLCVTPKASAA